MNTSDKDATTDDSIDLGPQLTDPGEVLFRQVHPSWIQAGKPTSQAFRPTPKDRGLLSVSRSSKTTASAAFELHNDQFVSLAFDHAFDNLPYSAPVHCNAHNNKKVGGTRPLGNST